MAVAALTNAHVYTSGVDLGGHSNEIVLDATAEELDSTVFNADGWRSREAGLLEVTSDATGFFDAQTVDAELFTTFGTSGIPYSVVPSAAAVGDVAYTTKVMRPAYQLGAQVGQLIPYASSVVGYGTPLVRGLVGHDGTVAVTATGNGSDVTLPAASSSQALYASLHVLSVSGTTPSLTVKVQSDVDDTFASALDQITFDAATSTGAQFKSTAGAITDTVYRVSYTVSGTSPSFLFAVVLGVAVAT